MTTSTHNRRRARLTTAFPDNTGHFGVYGGSFIAETLMDPVRELQEAYERYRQDNEFVTEFEWELKNFVGRPNPLYHARRLSDDLGGAQIYLKREDLNHTGAHKINNTVGQALLAAHGQEADHRRDRRGAARRGHGHGVRALLGTAVHRVHGGRGYPASGTQRLPYEDCWAPRWCR